MIFFLTISPGPSFNVLDIFLWLLRWSVFVQIVCRIHQLSLLMLWCIIRPNIIKLNVSLWVKETRKTVKHLICLCYLFHFTLGSSPCLPLPGNLIFCYHLIALARQNGLAVGADDARLFPFMNVCIINLMSSTSQLLSEQPFQLESQEFLLSCCAVYGTPFGREWVLRISLRSC